MKTILDKEQSQHLIDLGVPKEKASHVAVKQIYDFRGNSIKNPKEFIRKSPFRPAVMGFEAFDEHPIFKLEDFLNGEILPKEILIPNTKAYALRSNWFVGMQEWVVFYSEIESDERLSAKFAPELIDALYELACWYYGEYLKSEKKYPTD